MKILLLNQTFYPDSLATSQQLTDLALFLTEEGHQVTVVCDRSDYETRCATYPARENYRGIDIHRVKATGFGKLSVARRVIDGVTFSLFAFLKLMRLPRQDVVVSFTSPPLVGVPGTVYAGLTGARSVQWLMDINPDAAIAVGYLREASPAARLLLWIFGFTLKNSAAVVVLDRWMKERAVRRGADANAIAVVPPWPVHSAERGLPTGEISQFRRRNGLEGKTVVMYSGNHSVVHPLDTLLDAAARLKSDPDVRFVFVGGGLRVRDVSAWVEKHGLKNVIQLPRVPREELADMLGTVDLHVVVLGDAVNGLVHASKIYGILETGRPFLFIGQKESHIGELLPSCPAAFHVEHGDVDGLVRAVQGARSITDQRLRDHAQATSRMMRERYAPSVTLKTFAREVIDRLGQTAGEAAPGELKSARGAAK